MDSYSVYVAGRPKTKQRPSFVRATGIAYTPKETQDEEKRIAAAYNGPTFSGLLAVRIHFDADGQNIEVYEATDADRSKLTGDLDNYVKLTLDALQRSQAFADDRQIVAITASKS